MLILPFLVNSQKKEVLHQEYFKDGALQYEWYTQNNHPVKYWKTFFKNSSKYYLRNYNHKGNVISEGWILNNQKHGYWTEHLEHNVTAKGNYIKNLKEDNWEFFSKKHLDSIKKYHNNHLVKNLKNGYDKEYNLNGKLKAEGQYINNLREGYWKFYSKEGTLMKTGKFKNNLESGYWKFYSKKNTLCKTGRFKKGVKEGYWHFYTQEGIPLEAGSFKNGKKTKWWSFFNRIGQLTHKCELKENLKNGFCVHYQKDKIVKGTYYKKGAKTNEWRDWSSFKKDYKSINE